MGGKGSGRQQVPAGLPKAGDKPVLLPDTLGERPMAPGTTQASVNNTFALTLRLGAPQKPTVSCSDLTTCSDYPLLSDEGQAARTAVSRTGWLLLWPGCGVCGVGRRASGVCFSAEALYPLSWLLYSLGTREGPQGMNVNPVQKKPTMWE